MLPIARSWTRFAIALVIVGAGLTMIPPPAQANGCISPAAGTAQNPFIIGTPANLDCLVGNPGDYWGHGYHFRQTADLDMSGYAAWTRGIGSDDTAFNGTYDGDGFAIEDLTITSSGNSVGIFGTVTGATLKDITVTGLQVTGDRQVGGLVGRFDGGSIEGVQVAGTVTGLCTDNSRDCSVGGLVGFVDDSVPTTISRSRTSGSITATYSVGTSTYGRAAGGLIGSAGSLSLSIADSYSSAQVTGYRNVGGLMGYYEDPVGSEVLVVSDSYANGLVTATSEAGGLVGCFQDVTTNQCGSTSTSVTFTDTYWDTQTTGRSTTADNRGTGKTTAQMTDIATFAGWSIVDTTPDNATWGICSSLNGGYPFLQWVAERESGVCTAPSPPVPPTPAPVPATPPIDVEAEPGDRSAIVTWAAPSSSGSYAVSTYVVMSSPDARVCLSTTTTCTVRNLRNGMAYTFTVKALTGAGWSDPSAPSPEVVPHAPRTIVITGSRQGANVTIDGTSTGLVDEQLRVMVRLPGERAYSERGTVIPDARGAFAWSMTTGRSVAIYVAGDGVRSKRVIVGLPPETARRA